MQQSSATPSLHILVFGDFLNTMCGFPSVAIVSDWHFNNSLSTGSVLAHEIGHLFDMHHDELGKSAFPGFFVSQSKCHISQVLIAHVLMNGVSWQPMPTY